MIPTRARTDACFAILISFLFFTTPASSLQHEEVIDGTPAKNFASFETTYHPPDREFRDLEGVQHLPDDKAQIKTFYDESTLFEEANRLGIIDALRTGDANSGWIVHGAALGLWSHDQFPLSVLDAGGFRASSICTDTGCNSDMVYQGAGTIICNAGDDQEEPGGAIIFIVLHVCDDFGFEVLDDLLTICGFGDADAEGSTFPGGSTVKWVGEYVGSCLAFERLDV